MNFLACMLPGLTFRGGNDYSNILGKYKERDISTVKLTK